MAGNVAEWTSTVFTQAGVKSMSDLNPELKYNAAIDDPYRLKRKVVKGGSWKDPQSMVRSAWRTYECGNIRMSSAAISVSAVYVRLLPLKAKPISKMTTSKRIKI